VLDDPVPRIDRFRLHPESRTPFTVSVTMTGIKAMSPVFVTEMVKLAGSPGRIDCVKGVLLTRILGFHGTTLTSAEAFHCTMVYEGLGPYPFALT
jgi:hypothetical protein